MLKKAASLLRPARRSFRVVGSIVKGQLSKVLLLTLLFALFTWTLITPRPAFAAPGPPDPKPCQDALETNKLTDNYITTAEGKAPFEETPNFSGQLGQSITVTVNTSFDIDFSKLQAVFGVPNSNYLEGSFQDEKHQLEDIIGAKSADFNQFHGPGQKAAAKLIVDDLKVKYVNYVYNKPTLPEATAKYADISGQNPKTVYDLVGEFGLPQPPKPGDDRTTWLNTWGKYWEKIPTAYTEFYKGELQFRLAATAKQFALIDKGESCPSRLRTIEFVMPEFWRTTSISDQLNQIVVPCAAQSWRHGEGPNPNDADNCFRQSQAASSSPNQNASVLGKFIKACKDAIGGAQKTLIKQLRNAIQISLQILNPIKTALAEGPAPTPSPPPCLLPLKPGKQGNAPYCALPAGQLAPGDSCTNKVSAAKLDIENPNVDCNFQVSWSRPFTIRSNIDSDPKNRADDDFDSCTDDNGDGIYDCSITIKIWPVFRIPYLSEIWNNTLYSNEAEGKTGAGVGSPQLTGRPGIYSTFTPKAIYEKLFPNKYQQALAVLKDCTEKGDHDACGQLILALSACLNKSLDIAILLNPQEFQKAMTECAASVLGKNLPGEVAKGAVAGASSNVLGAATGDTKERFVGAVDCSKFFVRDISLKPKALQEAIGIDNQECNLTAAALPEAEGPPPGGGTGGDCGPTSNFGSLLPNPIPKSAGAVSPQLFPRLDSGKVVAAAKIAFEQTGTSCELLVGIHYIEASWNDTGSFISGRTIGTPEPDVSSAAACTAYGGMMTAAGCIFDTLEKTAIYAGDHIKDKMQLLGYGWRPPANFEEMIGSLSYYNGGGNANCGRPVPYGGPCPPPIGIDDPYAVSHFDDRHDTMFLIFCGDLKLCDEPIVFERDGAATAAKEFFLR